MCNKKKSRLIKTIKFRWVWLGLLLAMLLAITPHVQSGVMAASSERYLIDFYGRFDSSLSGSISTDRLLVGWELDDPAVVALAEGRKRDPAASGAPSVLGRQRGGDPGEPRLEALATAVHLSLPHDFTAMLAESPERAERWRRRVRETLTHYFERGYRAIRVVDDGYLLKRPAAVTETLQQEDGSQA